jgi:hypothetical protein
MFTDWITDFDWTEVSHETFIPGRERETGRLYIEAWERFTGLPYFIAPMLGGVYLGSNR